jgi:DNA-binding NarL/FixJ family response regulator
MVAITVLIADAQALFADVVGRALAHKPSIEVYEGRPSTATGTIDLATSTRPEVALVDYWLDVRPAEEVAQAILEVTPQTKLVHLSWVLARKRSMASTKRLVCTTRSRWVRNTATS